MDNFTHNLIKEYNKMKEAEKDNLVKNEESNQIEQTPDKEVEEAIRKAIHG